MMSEIRLDLLNDHYVLISPERLHKPDTHHVVQKKDSNPLCPFCEGNEDLTPPEIFALRDNAPNADMWRTRVVPNLYKAVQIELEAKSSRDGMFEMFSGVGAHEVLIDSPNHNAVFWKMETQNITNWLDSLVFRINDLKKDDRLIYLNIFKNSGRESGATQEHPHTQLLALPMMPKNILSFFKRDMKYYETHGRGIVEDLLNQELQSGQRIIARSREFVAYCPYASSFSFEVMIAPTSDIANLNLCSRVQIDELSNLIKKVFIALNKHLGEFDFNLSFQNSALNENFENQKYFKHMQHHHRFTLRIMPRIYRLGGFELSTSMAINPVSPEDCARLLRGD